MKIAIMIAAAIVFIGCAAAAPPPESLPPQTLFEKDIMDATAVVYGIADGDKPATFCTATAFEKKNGAYLFLTASHCLVELNRNKNIVSISPRTWYLSLDYEESFASRDPEKMFPVKIVAVGNPALGYDMAVLEVVLNKPITTIPLAFSDPKAGEPIINVGAPADRKKQLFRGHVRTEKFGHSIITWRGFRWRDAVILDMSAGASHDGTSGSAIISEKDQSVVGILVGRRFAGKEVALPVSQFRDFLTTRFSDLLAPIKKSQTFAWPFKSAG